MPRHTRSQAWRRLAAHAQAERDRQAQRLTIQLRALWRQHETGAAATAGPGGYHDPQLAAGSREAV
ncbi:MAG: hypothetical protein ACR2GH_15355 [Pseudonocardia sp.]